MRNQKAWRKPIMKLKMSPWTRRKQLKNPQWSLRNKSLKATFYCQAKSLNKFQLKRRKLITCLTNKKTKTNQKMIYLWKDHKPYIILLKRCRIQGCSWQKKSLNSRLSVITLSIRDKSIQKTCALTKKQITLMFGIKTQLLNSKASRIHQLKLMVFLLIRLKLIKCKKINTQMCLHTKQGLLPNIVFIEDS